MADLGGFRWLSGAASLAGAASSAGLRPNGFPYHPQAEEAASVPRRPRDGAGDGRKAGIGSILPDESVGGDGYRVPHAPVLPIRTVPGRGYGSVAGLTTLPRASPSSTLSVAVTELR
jgi:hypothetical protein